MKRPLARPVESSPQTRLPRSLPMAEAIQPTTVWLDSERDS